VPEGISKFQFKYNDNRGDTYIDYLDLPPGYYNTMEEITTKINAGLANSLATTRISNRIPVFKYDKVSRKLSAKIYKGQQIIFSESLCVILGIGQKNVIYTSLETTTWTSDGTCDPHRRIQSLFVYCDVLEHVPVGDVKAPLLRIVGVSGKEGDVVRRIFDKPLYVPVQKKNFESIEIDIRTDAGEVVPFEYGKSSVTLHFRLSKSPYFLQ
jgi:hypothetical protein